jgi:hypothetical protein
MSGLHGRTNGLPQAGAHRHHLAGLGNFQPAKWGVFQPALTLPSKMMTMRQPGAGPREVFMGGSHGHQSAPG